MILDSFSEGQGTKVDMYNLPPSFPVMKIFIELIKHLKQNSNEKQQHTFPFWGNNSLTIIKCGLIGLEHTDQDLFLCTILN